MQPVQNLALELFELRIKLDSKKTFITCEGQSFTYEEVFGRASKLAKHLQKLGLQPQERIVLRFWNEPEFVIAYFAVLLAGGVAVTISPLLTQSEIAHIVEHSGAHLILSFENQVNNQFLIEDIFHSRIKLLENTPDLNLLTPPLQNLSGSWRVIGNLPQDLAVLIYTSGTTTDPKGVMLTRQNIEAQVKAASKVLNLKKEDSFLGVLSLSHVFGQMDVLWASLFTGCQVHLIKHFDAKKALETIQQKEISVLIAVPTMYQLMVRQLEKNLMDFSKIRVCNSGAAPMTARLFEDIEKNFKAPVQEGYGLTETCSMAFSNPMEGPRKPLSVGKAIESISFKLINDTGNPIEAPNQIGEVCIKGPIITPGYFAAPEATSKSITEDGFLLTGDLGYFDVDGYLFLVDRKKDMIIRSGYKVYPREVEEVLMQHPMVFQAAVIGVNSALQINKIKAFVVLKTEAKAFCAVSGETNGQNNLQKKLIAELKDLCHSKLARFKIPNQFELVEEIPKTASGKLLKRKLISP
ncbi:MAG: AMP-binding protein [Candidatus Caenarcaniphilales bacterium]|nr:AMP-binding protein [Candidatus Caenarcaniphilales bacterium]